MSRPSLAQIYGNRRMTVLIGIGFASGLPLMLTSRTMKVWARDLGVDLTAVGLISLVTFPYTLKFLWAPLMDRFSPPMLGRRRGWIAITQALLVVAIAGMAVTGPRSASDSLFAFALMAVFVAFLGASQDIVADAYRTDVLARDELGAGASVYMTGYRLAMLASGAGAVYLADRLRWTWVYLIIAGGMVLGLIWTLLAPELETVAGSPATFAAAVIEPAREFARRNGWRALVILLFIIAFKLPDYMAASMTDALLLDVGFSKTRIAVWSLGVGTAVTIPGVLIGGPIVVRLGLVRALIVFGLAQALSNAGYLVLASIDRPIDWVMMLVVGIEYFCTGLVVAGFVAFLMSQCDKRYSATQYALLSSLMGLSNVLAGAPAGWLVDRLGYPWFFAVSILSGVPGLLMLFWIKEAQPRMEPQMNADTHREESE